jgi:hypothetical protein
MGRLMRRKLEPGPPMTLGNMRELGVHQPTGRGCELERLRAVQLARQALLSR